MTVTVDPIYYDPFDIEIDKGPYPVWRRMSEEVDVDWENAKQAHTAHVRGWEKLPVLTG